MAQPAPPAGHQGSSPPAGAILGPEVGRRLFHLVAASAFPVAALVAPLSWVRIAAIVAAGVLVIVETLRFAFPRVNRGVRLLLRPLLKAEETVIRPTGATYLALSTALCLFLFPKGIAVAALLFLAVGDPAAGVVGSRLGHWRLGRKSVEGTGAFTFAAALVGLALAAGGVLDNPWLALLGAAAAALTELAPVPGDDNVWVPLVSGAVMTGLSVLPPF